MTVRSLFRRVLPSVPLSSVLLSSVLVSSSFAATINVGPNDNVVGKVRAAGRGDVVQFSSGTFNVRSPIVVPTGVTLQGAPSFSSHVIFNLAGGEDSSYGFVIIGNAANVTLTGLDLVSNHGVVAMCSGSGYKNIQITRNQIQYGGGQFRNGTLVMGISGTIRNDGLQITHNYFHDSMSSCRNWNVWFATNANFDYNLFYKIVDGGQMNSPGPNVSFDYNYGTCMHRMGQEVSLQSSVDFEVKGNVFYDYIQPYYDTEGVSIVGGTGPVDITGNFFRASMAAGTTWGQPDGGGAHRFGYCIESTGRPSNVSGNTMVGIWASCVASDMAGASVTGNSVFGGGMWGNFTGEPGPFGYGSVRISGNTLNNVNAAPATPVNNFAGPQF